MGEGQRGQTTVWSKDGLGPLLICISACGGRSGKFGHRASSNRNRGRAGSNSAGSPRGSLPRRNCWPDKDFSGNVWQNPRRSTKEGCRGISPRKSNSYGKRHWGSHRYAEILMLPWWHSLGGPPWHRLASFGSEVRQHRNSSRSRRSTRTRDWGYLRRLSASRAGFRWPRQDRWRASHGDHPRKSQ